MILYLIIFISYSALGWLLMQPFPGKCMLFNIRHITIQFNNGEDKPGAFMFLFVYFAYFAYDWLIEYIY